MVDPCGGHELLGAGNTGEALSVGKGTGLAGKHGQSGNGVRQRRANFGRCGLRAGEGS